MLLMYGSVGDGHANRAQGHQLKTLISGCEMHHRLILARHGSGRGLRTWPCAQHTPRTTEGVLPVQGQL